jgi:hypothetical protein
MRFDLVSRGDPFWSARMGFADLENRFKPLGGSSPPASVACDRAGVAGITAGGAEATPDRQRNRAEVPKPGAQRNTIGVRRAGMERAWIASAHRVTSHST